MNRHDFEKYVNKVPETPGVYFFKKGRHVLYVGKATSLRDRTRSYFSRDLIDTRGPLIIKMIEEATSLSWQETESVLEALILEAHLIKKLTPPYNSKEKDNRSYNYVAITEEKYPRIITVRGREVALGKDKKGKNMPQYKAIFGPFPHGSQLKEALKIVRKIFPFRDKCIPFDERKTGGSLRPCFNRQIGMCPGVCTGEITHKDYLKIIRNIILFFEGKKSQVEKNLTKDMKGHIKTREFEKAEEVKRKLFALDHIRDVSLLKRDLDTREVDSNRESVFRIEAYDIAHTSGKETVGVMVVLENSEKAKHEYRKFKIRGDGNVRIDDVANLEEILVRRLGHSEWALPNLIVIDGGVAQKNRAEKVLRERGFGIDVVSVVKDDKHRPGEILGERRYVEKKAFEILLANNEAHRFSIEYHRRLFRPLRKK